MFKSSDFTLAWRISAPSGSIPVKPFHFQVRADLDHKNATENWIGLQLKFRQLRKLLAKKSSLLDQMISRSSDGNHFLNSTANIKNNLIILNIVLCFDDDYEKFSIQFSWFPRLKRVFQRWNIISRWFMCAGLSEASLDNGVQNFPRRIAQLCFLSIFLCIYPFFKQPLRHPQELHASFLTCNFADWFLQITSLQYSISGKVLQVIV